ncbi:MAG: DNA-binding protein [Candidatus Berkelbacteria bacterium]|nr:DNA-binding protein [Candidatus Berkelbacteria bacterium]
MKIIRLKKGDEILSGITKKLEAMGTKCGVVLGLGALSFAEIMNYNLKNKRFSSKKIEGALEIGSFTAVISRGTDSKIALHPHIVISDNKFKTFAGHLKKGIVSATFEAVIFESNESISRYFDSKIGLNLLKLD